MPLDDYRPEESRKLTHKLPVAEIQDSISELSIRDVVSKTPINNDPEEADWNCQNWVGDALARMVNNGYFNAFQRASAIDQMTDACLEAEDE